MSKVLVKAWDSLANEQKLAAEVLREKHLHRASIGRAYYAAYSGVTSALIGSGRRDFGRFKNPDHASLPVVVGNGLGSIGPIDRRVLAAALRRLRSRREDADYQPTASVTEAMSRESLSDLANVRGVLERTGA